MNRFIEGVSRAQVSLLPECLDDFVAEDNPIRVVEAFVEQLDLVALEFDGATPAVTGRPSYHPAVLLKVYIYGYLNRIQSSRRLERECQRNLELMWLTGRLAPDFKTIADFRRDNGKAIRNVCRQFVVLCRQLDLFSQSLVAIDGSKFKAVNNRDRNFTHGKLRARMEQIEKSIERYLAAMDTADRTQSDFAEAKVSRLQDKTEKLRQQMQALKEMEQQLREAPDGQVSLTDPDARSMATSGKGTGVVGYNVQTAVDTQHHLIVAHEVTNVGHDRAALATMAGQAREATGSERLSVIADRGYFSGVEILACEQAGITPFVPKPLTSSSKAEGRFGKQDFIYIAADDEYQCPAGHRAIKRFSTVEDGLELDAYWSSACPSCSIRGRCTTSSYRRLKRWRHEAVLEAMQQRLDRQPEMMSVRRQTVEHPFGTLKHWMGSTHFLTRTLPRVSTEMSLHVLAYNLKRLLSIFGVSGAMEALRA
ncbi:IS1182 family transposase [Pseudomonas citronellolis]|uniref:IS1182 family transposase n=1 Tax=Pseudomonas aeruginosa group TaxID=136841 RepID=UPI001CD5FDC1|nr:MULTISPECIES: IS1182 family transposase [Pseudomonas aeruginosa group]UUC48114.1 IS1182 family transposase [Pseudomonas citronellolis]HCF6146667.1 IS1182 family transposase [Pseudomonas aeruginosa]HCT7938082.1 IS1182 family transposase [Pseudomonas aeruginosa]